MAALSLSFAGYAGATSADFDAVFGSGGKVTHSVVSGEDSAEGIALQNDGKIVAAGRAYNGLNYDFAVTRFNADGTPDTTFGDDGNVTTFLGTTRDEINAVAIQPDGKIVVAGFFDAGTKDYISLARFKTDGTLDETFGGGDGSSYFWFGGAGSSDAYANALVLQPDGKILMAGYTNTGGTNDFAVVRANADGTPDTSFGTGGNVSTPIGTSSDRANAIALQPDGKIVVAGETDGGASNFDFAIARYEGSGSLDTSFNGSGIQVTSLSSGGDYGEALALRPDGTIVVAGGTRIAGVNNAVLVRYKPNGSLDGTFGAGGVVNTYAAPGETYANAVALQNNDKIVAAGWYYDGVNYDYLLTQYNATGALDSSFDGDGIRIAGIGPGDDHANGMAIQTDGKIVAGGQSNTGSNFDFSFARFAGEQQFLPVVAPPPVTPIAAIGSPRGGKIASRKLKRFAGTAGPTGEVEGVEIALRRIDRRALKKGRCVWLRDAASKFTKTRGRGKRCSTPRFLSANGKESWSFKLRKRLPAGRYELYARVSLKNGSRHTDFRASDGNFRAFKVT